ncbi:MAG: BtrH N-terminal domain-containing protein [Neisseria sp.]|nr:BtrH N-terminal domain-containing protein [Neisseria sp.]
MTPTFPHQHTAHCESGVMSALLRHHGIDWDEAMVFGLSSALSFAYIPVVKLSGQPLAAYRSLPKSIIKRSCRLLGIRLQMKTFRSEAAGMAALDKVLEAGGLAGLQTSVFWLPYFPAEMRFHFNAHNLLVYGKENGEYLISDPVFETVQRCSAEDLRRARFAKGVMAAKGLMYTLGGVPSADAVAEKMPQLVRAALLKTARQMRPPVFFAGVNGIRMLARKIAALNPAPEYARANSLFLGHIVRMQEEIGTGGAGFRYIYACFMQQAAGLLGSAELSALADRLTAIGDEWRLFAAQAVRQCRKPQADGCRLLAQMLYRIADLEETLWRDTAAWAKAI